MSSRSFIAVTKMLPSPFMATKPEDLLDEHSAADHDAATCRTDHLCQVSEGNDVAGESAESNTACRLGGRAGRSLGAARRSGSSICRIGAVTPTGSANR